MWLVICFIKKAQQKTLRNGEFFVVVIITKGMRVKCTPKSDFGVCASVIGFINNIVFIGNFEIDQHQNKKGDGNDDILHYFKF